MSDGTNTGIIVLVILLGVVIVIGVAAAVLVLSNAWGVMPHMGWFMWWFMINHMLEEQSILLLLSGLPIL